VNSVRTTRIRWLAIGLLLTVGVLLLAWEWQQGYRMRPLDFIALGFCMGAFGLVELWIARRSASPLLRSSAIGGIGAGLTLLLAGVAVFAVHGLS
jgi:hypothetical protein